MSVDLSVITGLTVQIDALEQEALSATDPATKALFAAQVRIAQAQLKAEAARQEASLASSNTIMSALGLFSTLTQVVGNNAPTILTLFGVKA